MSPVEGFDFSYNPPDMQRAAELGYKFAVSYLHYAGAPSGKCLTRARVRSIFAAGLSLVCNLEVTSGRMKGGRTLGVADAKDALASLRDLGLPETTVVYFSADFDTTSADYPAIDAYLKGAASVLPGGAQQVGIYGEASVVAHCQKAKTAHYFWQTYAWSYGKVADGIHAYQHQNHVKVAGGVVDLDWGYGTNFGQVTPTLPDSSTEEPMYEITSDLPRLIEVPSGTAVFDIATGKKITDTATTFQRSVSLQVNGLPNRTADFFLGRFPNAGSGTPVTAVRVSDVKVLAVLTPPTADATPFDQAYVDAAVAAQKQLDQALIEDTASKERERIAQAEAARIRAL